MTDDAEYFARAGIVAGLIPATNLPKARLELSWGKLERDDDGYTLECRYEIVVPLFHLDIRGEVYDDEHNLIERKKELRLSLGGTRTRGSSDVDVGRGTIRTPFRDHAHIRLDSLHTGLPAYVVSDGWAMRLLPATPEAGTP